VRTFINETFRDSYETERPFGSNLCGQSINMMSSGCMRIQAYSELILGLRFFSADIEDRPDKSLGSPRWHASLPQLFSARRNVLNVTKADSSELIIPQT